MLGDILPVLSNVDYAVANLESPVTDSDVNINKNSICLKAKPEQLRLLKACGINVLALANNHILDYCEKGLQDTVQLAAELNVPVYGANSMETAARAHFVTLGERKVGFLAFAEQEFNCAQKNRIGANRWDDL